MNDRSSKPIEVRAVDPRTFTDNDFRELNEVNQDMWSTEKGLWELANCSCGKMLSKERVFWHLPYEEYSFTVAEIMRRRAMDVIECPDCGGRAELSYGESYIGELRNKLLDSEDSFLSVARDDKGKMVGFAEGYIDPLESILSRRDLWDHFWETGFSHVQEKVAQTLGYSPDSIFLLSSTGILEKYANPITLISLLGALFKSIPERYDGMSGIMELERTNMLHVVAESLGGRPAGITYSKSVDGGIDYNSELIVFDDIVRTGRENFSVWPMNFLRRLRSAKRNRIPTVAHLPVSQIIQPVPMLG